MNRGTLIALVVLAAYVGFEAYAIRAASERTEPAYIHNLLIEAETATELCESDALALRSRFKRTVERVTASYRKDLASKNPDVTQSDIDALLAQQVADAQRAVSNAVETSGCEHADARAHFQRYRIYAGKTR